MSRSRTVLVGVSAALVAVLIAGCGGTDSPAGPGDPATITYVSYGGFGQEAQAQAFQEPYTAAHPEVTFVNSSPAEVAQVQAQVEAGVVQWDVMSVAPAAATQNCGTLFERLDLSTLDPDDYVAKTIGECYVGNFANATIFGYNPATYPDASTAPKSIADFFDTARFPGKRGVITNLQNGILEFPLLADGVDPGSLYPLDVDRALAVWDTIRDDTLFAPNVGALQQAVSADQVDMFLLADSRLVALLDEGKAVTMVWDTTVVSVNGLAIVKGSPNKAVAEDFLASLVQAGPQETMAELTGVTPINLHAKPDLTDNGRQVEAYGAVNTGTVVVQDIDWYAQNFNEVSARLNTWLVG